MRRARQRVFCFPLPQDHAPGDDDNPGAFDKLRADIPNINGKTAVVETTAAGWGEGKVGRTLDGLENVTPGSDAPR